MRVIFDRRLRTEPSARLFSTLGAGPVVVVTADEHVNGMRATHLRRAGAEIVSADTLGAALGVLAQRDVTTLLVEGGPTLQRSFVQAGLADAVNLIVAPCHLGDGGVPWLDAQTLPAESLRPTLVEPRGPDIWIEADVHRDR
jgi:diaminohydroxyphosphoribosylaminopyrimidine deaminase/5-amino-6-(5-phosphoribosylamino)uracil reductase